MEAFGNKVLQQCQELLYQTPPANGFMPQPVSKACGNKTRRFMFLLQYNQRWEFSWKVDQPNQTKTIVYATGKIPETFTWKRLIPHNKFLDVCCLWGAGMAQWWEHSPPTNVGWVCWFSALHRAVFSGNSGFPSPQKTKFDLIVLIVNFSCSVLNSCYYSWARRQNFFCLQLHATEAKGSIQWEMTHYPRLCVKTAGNCNNSY